MAERPEEEIGPEAEAAHELLKGLLQRMGMRATVTVRVEEGQLLVDIGGPDSGRLIGKKGQTLDAIQIILGKMVARRVGRSLMMTVDAGGYRERRAESLEELAHRLRQKAIDSGRTVALNPMSARDRRIIHVALRDAEDVSTRSEGEGDQRRLLIVPE
jgi:spoIIIJ-associated protein